MEIRDILIGLILLLIMLAVTDCSVGKTVYCEGQVRAHLFQPAYTTHDKDGSTHHSAEYHLLVYIPKPEHVAKVNVSWTRYALYQDNDWVTVGERRGRWTSYCYLNWIKKPDFD